MAMPFQHIEPQTKIYIDSHNHFYIHKYNWCVVIVVHRGYSLSELLCMCMNVLFVHTNLNIYASENTYHSSRIILKNAVIMED